MEITLDRLENYPVPIFIPAEPANGFGLRVEKVSLERYPAASRVLSAWERVAMEKWRNTMNVEEREQFQNCRQIARCVRGSLEDPDEEEEIYFCLDRFGNIQAAIVLEPLEEDELHIDFLVTNPINIRSEANKDETQKVRGAGSLLLREAERIAMKGNQSRVSLSPLPGAIEFYRKNGYSGDRWGSMMKNVKLISDTIAPQFFPILAAA